MASGGGASSAAGRLAGSLLVGGCTTGDSGTCRGRRTRCSTGMVLVQDQPASDAARKHGQRRAAITAGRHYIGVEIDETHAANANQRLEAALRDRQPALALEAVE